jgi:hypothetical protein
MSARPLLASLVILVGCSGGRSNGNNGNGMFPGGGTGPTEGQEAKPCAKMDLLFVVDDSGSMEEEQSNLAVNFPKFVSVLDNFVTSAGDQLDYRIGITTTGRDVTYTIALPPPFPPFPPMTEHGSNGAFRNLPECGMTKSWIDWSDNDPSSEFACAAHVGTSGPSLEMPLNGVKMALTDRMDDGTNVGFLRDDALLALVILTDEDDCSREDDNFAIASDSCDPSPPEVQPLTKYLDLLDTIKQARGRWAAAVIAGPGPSDCSSAFGQAGNAKRLHSFVDQAGDQAIFSSICAGDLTQALNDALGKFTAACESFTVL